jgi:predicted RNA polymerase sigma factor
MVRRMRRLPAAGGKAAADKASFKQRYEEAEQRRAAILQRLAGLNGAARAHPAYRRALTLVNQTFRKASVAQRLTTLQAAEWLINVLENLTTFV